MEKILDSNPPTCRQMENLCSVVPNSTPLSFDNNQLVNLLPVGVLNCVKLVLIFCFMYIYVHGPTRFQLFIQSCIFYFIVMYMYMCGSKQFHFHVLLFLFALQIQCIQIKCYHEIISIGHKKYQKYNLPWFRSLSWYVHLRFRYS